MIRQLLTESCCSRSPAASSALLARWGVVARSSPLAPADLPRMHEVTVDWRVLLVTALASMLTGVFVGLLPALSSASVESAATLQEHSRGTVGGAFRRRARAALVVAEVALAVTFTTGAGLLLRSFVVSSNVNPGFDTEHLLTWQMNMPIACTPTTERLAFYRDFFARMEALPGVAGRRRDDPDSARQYQRVDNDSGRRPAGTGGRVARSAVPPRDARLLPRDGHPGHARARLHAR